MAKTTVAQLSFWQLSFYIKNKKNPESLSLNSLQEYDFKHNDAAKQTSKFDVFYVVE